LHVARSFLITFTKVKNPRSFGLGIFVDQKDAENTIRAETHSDNYVEGQWHSKYYPQWREFNDSDECLHIESEEKDRMYQYKLWVEKSAVQPKRSVGEAEIFDKDIHVEIGGESGRKDSSKDGGEAAHNENWAEVYSNAVEE
jgi:hypothetical protein